jgi:predicted nucleic acid-binding Zn ribbon protein
MSTKSYKFKKFQDTPDEDGIIPHKHCPVCGRQIYELELEYCSDACAQLSKNKEKGQKKKIFKYIGIAVAVLVGSIILALAF